MEIVSGSVLFFKEDMAQINVVETVSRRKGGSRIKKSDLRIDMTPMVDLGFLLICFFVFTTTMSERKVTDLFMPVDGPPILVKISASLTILLGSNENVFCYDGAWEEAVNNNRVMKSGYSIDNGLGNIIRAKQKAMNLDKNDDNGRNNLILIIKATRDASYKHLMDVLDEVLINDIKHYAVVDLTREENAYLNR